MQICWPLWEGAEHHQGGSQAHQSDTNDAIDADCVECASALVVAGASL
jgi:hypothetical protein